MHEKLALADLMLMPSELESFGLAALEAMACEVVPIATRVGGVPEVIEHGKSGFLADVGDVETMARYAIELLSDEDRLKEMRQACRAVAQSQILFFRRLFRNMKIFIAACWNVLRRVQRPENASLGRIGKRKRIKVPFPSRLSMVMRAVSPYKTFNLSATFGHSDPGSAQSRWFFQELRRAHAHTVVFHFNNYLRVG